MIRLERSQWGATQPPSGGNMPLPAEGVTFHHTVTIATDDHDLYATADVAHDARVIEQVGIQRRLGGFPYSFSIHPSGVVVVGAGFTIGAHTKGSNSTRFGISFIGNLSTSAPTPEALEAASEVLAWLEETGRLVHGYDVDGHRNHKATECPGNQLYTQLGAIHARALSITNNNNEENEMTPEQEQQLASTARKVDTMEEQVAGLSLMVGVIYEQLIGGKGDAGPEALRQLLRETGADADATEKRTRPAKMAAPAKKAAAAKKAAPARQG